MPQSQTQKKIISIFREQLSAQNLKRIEYRSSSTFSVAKFVKVEPARFKTSKQIAYNHARRSEAAKKGWITRRANIEKQELIKKGEETLRKQEPEDMARCTWGTGLSDKNVPFSFTFYTFSEENLDRPDMDRCEDKFITLIDRWMRQQYPGRGYNYDASESAGWIKTIVRSEENQSVNYDKNYCEKWVFEIDHQEEDSGQLDEIL